MVKEMMQVRKENEEFKMEVRRMKSVDKDRTKTGMYEKNKSWKTGVNMAKRLTNEKTIEKLEWVEDGMMMNKSDIRKQIDEGNYEAIK